MKLNNYKLLVIGKSGSGKDAIVRELIKRGLVPLVSYTTRPKRPDDDQYSHTFVSKDVLDKTPREHIIAYAELYGNVYWATKDQFDNCDIYIVDPKEAVRLKKEYNKCLIIAVETDMGNIQARLDRRYDKNSERKYKEDLTVHKDNKKIADFIVNNNGNLQDSISSLIVWLFNNQYLNF